MLVTCRFYVSRLMLRPKRPYKIFFNSPISSWTDSSLDFSASTSSSMVCVELSRSSSTCGCGNETKQSPTLYLQVCQSSFVIIFTLQEYEAGRTALFPLHPQAQALSRSPQGPPFPSAWSQHTVNITSLAVLPSQTVCSDPTFCWIGKMQQEEQQVTRGRTYNLRPQLLF